MGMWGGCDGGVYEPLHTILQTTHPLFTSLGVHLFNKRLGNYPLVLGTTSLVWAAMAIMATKQEARERDLNMYTTIALVSTSVIVERVTAQRKHRSK